MDKQTYGQVDDRTDSEVGKQLERCAQRRASLDLLKVETGEELHRIHNAIGEEDHDARSCEGGVSPECVWDQRRFGVMSAVVHPERKSDKEYYRERQERGGGG